MSTESLRQQIRATLQTQLAAQRPGAALAQNLRPISKNAPHAPYALMIPLQLGSAQDASVLTQLFQRLAASPALLKMADEGYLRFDLRVEAAALGAVPNAVAIGKEANANGTSAMAATTAIDPATCCSSCKAGKACECKGDTCALHDHPAEDIPELKGVIGEKLLKTLPPSVKTVRLHPKAVMTPLGKEALRKRGITIERGTKP
jgi:hypothetical protein